MTEFNEESEGFKEWLQFAAGKATKEASERFLETMGFMIIKKDGWFVKEFKDGTIEKISEIKNVEILNKDTMFKEQA